MNIPAWSQFSNLPALQVAFEKWTFQTLLLERLSEVVGIGVCSNVSALSPAAQAVIASFKTAKVSGILSTKNAKRLSTSFSLVYEGECIACVYLKGNYQLNESLEICCKAVQRDLLNELTLVTFSYIDKELTNSLAAVLVGVSEYQLQGFCLQDEVERLLEQPSCRHRSALIVATVCDANYYIFINDSVLVGVMVAIYCARGPKIGFSRDISMLSFESKFNSEAYLEIFGFE